MGMCGVGWMDVYKKDPDRGSVNMQSPLQWPSLEGSEHTSLVLHHYPCFWEEISSQIEGNYTWALQFTVILREEKQRLKNHSMLCIFLQLTSSRNMGMKTKGWREERKQLVMENSLAYYLIQIKIRSTDFLPNHCNLKQNLLYFTWEKRCRE